MKHFDGRQTKVVTKSHVCVFSSFLIYFSHLLDCTQPAKFKNIVLVQWLIDRSLQFSTFVFDYL